MKKEIKRINLTFSGDLLPEYYMIVEEAKKKGLAPTTYVHQLFNLAREQENQKMDMYDIFEKFNISINANINNGIGNLLSISLQNLVLVNALWESLNIYLPMKENDDSKKLQIMELFERTYREVLSLISEKFNVSEINLEND